MFIIAMKQMYKSNPATLGIIECINVKYVMKVFRILDNWEVIAAIDIQVRVYYITIRK
jgi:hypothetical protein